MGGLAGTQRLIHESERGNHGSVARGALVLSGVGVLLGASAGAMNLVDRAGSGNKLSIGIGLAAVLGVAVLGSTFAFDVPFEE